MKINDVIDLLEEIEGLTTNTYSRGELDVFGCCSHCGIDLKKTQEHRKDCLMIRIKLAKEYLKNVDIH